MKRKKNEIFRQIPSVDYLLGLSSFKKVLKANSKALVLRAIHETLDRLRRQIDEAQTDFDLPDLGTSGVVDKINARLSELVHPSLCHVINATGIIIHTNLGRSPLPEEVIQNLTVLSGSYCNLEFDLHTGKRGTRYDHVEDILREVTGAESAAVVNNNAAAVMLALNTIAEGKEVIISRGQLVEIGGSFRMPDVMNKSGARMVEVGTTNKTTLLDYDSAITSETALLLKVHTSNFEIVGFTEEVSLEDLVFLGKKKGLPVMEDLGSGCLVDLSGFGLKKEPTVQDSIRKGVDIITFSGDKMLGGPQCGIILGKKEVLSRIKANQLNRALRVDKLTLIALEQTLRLYRNTGEAISRIPVLKMICEPYAKIQQKARRLLRLIGKIKEKGCEVSLCKGSSRVGGGAMPLEKIQTKILCIYPKELKPTYIMKFLRSYKPPIIARLEKDKILLDTRTILDKEIPLVAKAIKELSEKA